MFNVSEVDRSRGFAGALAGRGLDRLVGVENAVLVRCVDRVIRRCRPNPAEEQVGLAPA